MGELLWSPFDLQQEMTTEQLDYFKDMVQYDDEGDMLGFKRYEYLGQMVERVLDGKNKLRPQKHLVDKYNYGIKKKKNMQKNSKAKRELRIVDSNSADDEGRTMYGTITEDLVSATRENIFNSTEVVDDIDSIMTNITHYNNIKLEFQMLEGVDLDLLLVRALEEVPQAVLTLKRLVQKHRYLSPIIEDVLKARSLGYDVLPNLE